MFLNVNFLILINHHLTVVRNWVPFTKQSILHTFLQEPYKGGYHCLHFTDGKLESPVNV